MITVPPDGGVSGNGVIGCGVTGTGEIGSLVVELPLLLEEPESELPL
ncbi:hypothetical protein [Flagellimonas lutimaris]